MAPNAANAAPTRVMLNLFTTYPYHFRAANRACEEQLLSCFDDPVGPFCSLGTAKSPDLLAYYNERRKQQQQDPRRLAPCVLESRQTDRLLNDVQNERRCCQTYPEQPTGTLVSLDCDNRECRITSGKWRDAQLAAHCCLARADLRPVAQTIDWRRANPAG